MWDCGDAKKSNTDNSGDEQAVSNSWAQFSACKTKTMRRTGRSCSVDGSQTVKLVTGKEERELKSKVLDSCFRERKSKKRESIAYCEKGCPFL